MEERQDVAALQLAANDHLAAGVSPMNLGDKVDDEAVAGPKPIATVDYLLGQQGQAMSAYRDPI